MNSLETTHTTVANKPRWLCDNCQEQCKKSYQTISTCICHKEVGDGSREIQSPFMLIKERGRVGGAELPETICME